jgi:hypothetical protein
MTTHTIYSALIWLAFGICAIICAAFWIVEYGKKQLKREREYENAYYYLGHLINNLDINKSHYDLISDGLEKLKSLKWKNKEKTEMLILNFRKKYTKEWLRSIDRKKTCRTCFKAK